MEQMRIKLRDAFRRAKTSEIVRTLTLSTVDPMEIALWRTMADISSRLEPLSDWRQDYLVAQILEKLDEKGWLLAPKREGFPPPRKLLGVVLDSFLRRAHEYDPMQESFRKYLNYIRKEEHDGVSSLALLLSNIEEVREIAQKVLGQPLPEVSPKPGF